MTHLTSRATPVTSGASPSLTLATMQATQENGPHR